MYTFRLRILLCSLLLAWAAPALCGAEQQFSAAAWRQVKTYEMAALASAEPIPLRRIVGVRFNYRHRDVRHLKPNWFSGTIWSVAHTEQRTNFNHIPIMVAKADLPAFQALPTDAATGGDHVVYGQVLQDSEANFLFLRLLGTKMKRDARGQVTVSW